MVAAQWNALPLQPLSMTPCCRHAGRDDLVYGSARPGARGQRCFNPEDKVTETEGRWVHDGMDICTLQGDQQDVNPPILCRSPRVGHVHEGEGRPKGHRPSEPVRSISHRKAEVLYHFLQGREEREALHPISSFNPSGPSTKRLS